MGKQEILSSPQQGTIAGVSPAIRSVRDFKRILADKIKNGEHVALYCYGILASHLICYLEKFYGVVPTVVIDNDERKRGTAEFGIPVMPFIEVQGRFADLQYFICSDDFKYTIIGDLLEKGVQPESIINYVPVEKRQSCLSFYNQMLITLCVREDRSQEIGHCNNDSFKAAPIGIQIPIGDGAYSGLKGILNKEDTAFQNGDIAHCRSCVLNKEQYMATRGYKKHYKQVVFHQETCSDCICHCTYCCVEGADTNSKIKGIFGTDTIEYHTRFVDQLFSLGEISDDFSCLIDMSERDYDEKIGFIMGRLEKAELRPLVYKVSSCLVVYSENLEMLIRQGLVYIIWSLDAGNRETYRKIKQIDAFDKAVSNVRRYIEKDAFGGRFIVAKYLIIKGINNCEEEFDAFLQLVTGLGLRFISLSFDFNQKANEEDLKFIRQCSEKASACGLQLTYKNNSQPVTEALNMNSMLTQ